MPPDTAPALYRRDGNAVSSLAAHWRKPLAHYGVASLTIFVLTIGEWLTMFDQWWNISTYNHILFVPLIIGWLIYTRRKLLSAIIPSAWWPGLIPLAVSLMLWLLGSIGGLNSASQLGAVMALQASALAILGPRFTLACAFPIAYALFLVPFGDELVPTLQMITADMVIALTHWSGIPAVIDGVFIDTPVGLFEVAEACSGVKFLIAMLALGSLVAYTCFRSWKRRAIFMIAAIALPIGANGVRAWGTIYIAQFQGIEFAEGFDHIFYGWVFFALLVGFLLAVAWRWFDRDPDDLGADLMVEDLPRNLQTWVTLRGGYRVVTAISVAMAVLFGIWNVTAMQVQAAVPQQIALPTVSGWTRIPYDPATPWQPTATGAEHRLTGRYRNDDGHEVDVFVGYFAGSDTDASAYGEGALDKGSDWRWLQPGAPVTNAVSDYLLIYGQHRRLVQTSYRTGGTLTGSALALKFANMRDRLLLQAEPTVMLILSSEMQGLGAAERAIADFRQTIGDEGEWLDRIAHRR